MAIPEHVIVLHIDKDGDICVRAWSDERVCILWVDENCKSDRVYCHTSRETDPEQLRSLLGDSPIGHLRDGRIDEQTEQAIRAMSWRLKGGRLSTIEPVGEI